MGVEFFTSSTELFITTTPSAKCRTTNEWSPARAQEISAQNFSKETSLILPTAPCLVETSRKSVSVPDFCITYNKFLLPLFMMDTSRSLLDNQTANPNSMLTPRNEAAATTSAVVKRVKGNDTRQPDALSATSGTAFYATKYFCHRFY
mmetsp:Transcript_12966/g.20792  ORF Transcript_12966/g.20792 Transcript_12966/m.20792 type:complete len:148 (+) Transcript_12966:194-637(+)